MTNQPSHHHGCPAAPGSTRGVGGGAWAGLMAALGAVAARARHQAEEQSRYWRALRELRRLDDRDLDDLAIGRADLPEMARRHARASG